MWKFFDDIPQVAACLPGAELTEDLGDDTYRGKVAIRMGPVKMQFAGTATITERDETAKRIVVDAAGAEEKGRGQAAMLVTAHLVPAGRGTKVEVVQDLQLSGAAAQYGRGMISDVTAVLMRDFAANMQRRIGAIDRGLSPDQVGAAAPASGFAIGLRAMRMALTRVFRRFFAALPAQPELRRTTHGAVVDRQRAAAAGRRARARRPAQPACWPRSSASAGRPTTSSPAASRWSGSWTSVPEMLATTDRTIDDVAVGAVRYAGSVAKLLG